MPSDGADREGLLRRVGVDGGEPGEPADGGTRRVVRSPGIVPRKLETLTAR
jgi:hypothetical protein